MSASWDKWEESFHTVKEANLTVYFLIRWINKFAQNCQWRSYIKRQNTSRTHEGRHVLRRTRNCFLDISLLFFFLVTSWLSRAVASFWTSGVSSWVPLMTLLSAARDWWILWKKNILRWVFMLFIHLRLDYHSTSWLVRKDPPWQTCYWSDLCVHLTNVINEIN